MHVTSVNLVTLYLQYVIASRTVGTNAFGYNYKSTFSVSSVVPCRIVMLFEYGFHCIKYFKLYSGLTME
jgi:hypothetical protein